MMGNLLLVVCGLIVAAKAAPYGMMWTNDVERTGRECHEAPGKKCVYPNYWIHFWTRTKCLYGNYKGIANVPQRRRGGDDECWYLSWYWFWLWLAIGATTVLGILGCCLAPLCDASSFKYCLAGTGIGAGFCCPLISWGFMCCIYIDLERCELCQKTFRRSIFKFLDNSVEHKKYCLEENLSIYIDIPNSTLYTCKHCENPLKVWPVDKLAESKCTKCENKIINDGTNLHVCFTCAGKGEKKKAFHHICSRHWYGMVWHGMLEVNFQTYKTSLEVKPTGPSDQPQSNSRQHAHQFNKEASQVPEHSNVLPPAMPPVPPGNVLPPANPSAPPGNVLPPAKPPAPPGNVLPPGWQVMTNPVTGAPYGLCDPSGEIHPVISNNTSSPPPYAEAVAYQPTLQ